MKNWNDVIAFFFNLTPPFIASLTGAIITFLMRVRQHQQELKDTILEAAFCVPFGTLLGFVVNSFGAGDSWSIAAASLGGMFGEKIYTRLSKRVDSFETKDLLDPLSILKHENEKTSSVTEHNDNHMTKKHTGYFLGIGLNGVNPQQYNGWNGQLKGSVNDINQLSILAQNKDFYVKTLLNQKADLMHIRAALEDLKDEAKSGDTVWIAYSGHGGQTKNDAGNTLETYCFYDGQMADFEMLNHIAGFAPGVEVILSLDCCHSGGFDRAMFAETSNLREKAMPKDIALGLSVEHISDIKQGIRLANIDMKGGQSLVILAACQKNQSAYDGDQNGLFTAAMLKTHLSDEDLTYSQFVEKIVELCQPNQMPRMVVRPKTSKMSEQIHFTIEH